VTKVIPKDLWIEQVIHALTVTKEWVIHALTVTKSRINGHNTIYSLYLPIVKTPVVGASLFGDNLAGCHTNRLHLPPTAVLKNSIKTKLPLILLVVGLAGCQQKIPPPIKSEIDKCIEAHWEYHMALLKDVNTLVGGGKNPVIDKTAELKHKLNYRMECLKAQAGGK